MQYAITGGYVLQVVIALTIDPICLLLLTDTTCPGRGCIGLQLFALLVNYTFGLACLPVAHLDERTFQYFLLEALWAFFSVFMQSRYICDFTLSPFSLVIGVEHMPQAQPGPRCCVCF